MRSAPHGTGRGRGRARARRRRVTCPYLVSTTHQHLQDSAANKFLVRTPPLHSQHPSGAAAAAAAPTTWHTCAHQYPGGTAPLGVGCGLLFWWPAGLRGVLLHQRCSADGGSCNEPLASVGSCNWLTRKPAWAEVPPAPLPPPPQPAAPPCPFCCLAPSCPPARPAPCRVQGSQQAVRGTTDSLTSTRQQAGGHLDVPPCASNNSHTVN